MEKKTKANDLKKVIGMRMDKLLHAKLKRYCSDNNTTITDLITEYVIATTKGMRTLKKDK